MNYLHSGQRLPMNLQEYEILALTKLPEMVWDFFAGGSEDEVSLRANVAAFSNIQLRPRMLVDVSQPNLSTTVLGIPLPMPVMIAPMGIQGLAHEEGECGMARGAGAQQTLMIASCMSNRTLEEIAIAASTPLWLQMYIFRDRAVSERLVRRAEVAGYRALVLTVDVPRLGRRERDVRNGFGLPAPLRYANFDSEAGTLRHSIQPGTSALAQHTLATLDDRLTWKDLAWLRSLTRLPIILKGIMTAEDAQLAVAHGVDGIVVSNHGGRQLDGVAATISVLPEVVNAVAGRCEVYMDGGIRRGSDVVKAIALGARAVLVGRPLLWGLAINGEAGVAHALQLLQNEIELTLQLLGCPTLSDLNRSFVRL